jgi:hypothetical protein
MIHMQVAMVTAADASCPTLCLYLTLLLKKTMLTNCAKVKGFIMTLSYVGAMHFDRGHLFGHLLLMDAIHVTMLTSYTLYSPLPFPYFPYHFPNGFPYIFISLF